MKRMGPRRLTFLGVAAVLALFIHMGTMFWPYLSGTMLISNDYLAIPGETKIAGTYVRNPEYIRILLANENQLLAAGEPDGSPHPAEGRDLVEGQRRLNEFQEFMAKNRLELEFQSQCGWIMHHHNSMLAPINEYLLGKRVTDINHQYGWLNTLLLGHPMKWTGGLTFQNYFRVLYAFYPIYYLLFLGVVFLLTRSVGYVLLTALVSFALLHFLNYLHILLAPGFNPLRQLFYLPVTLFLFFYLKKGGLHYLLLASFFALVSILGNKEFGLFVVAALTASLALRMLHEKRKVDWAETTAITLTIGLAIGVLLFAKMGKNPSGQYYLRGISGPPMEKPVMVAVLLFMSLTYGWMVKVLNYKDGLKYVAFFLFVYFQGVFFYYVWNSAPNHFFSVASPMVLGGILFLKLGLEAREHIRLARTALAVLISVAFLGLYVPSLVTYYLEKQRYERIFEDRRIFEWNLPTARIRTTMDPAYLVEAVQLIQRYSPKGGPIFIISKYDNLLPFLAARYSAMPFSEVPTSLVTRREVCLCIDTLLEERPAYIFVDTDLVENPFGSGIDPKNPMILLVEEQFDLKAKLKMLEELTRVYLGVRHHYEVTEKGPLLSVVQRKER